MSRLILFIGSDHAGLQLKEFLKKKLAETSDNAITVTDVGTHSPESCDYPDFAAKVANQVSAAATAGSSNTLGVLVCGSGIGMAISANKIPHVRATVAWDASSARLCREHNDVNVLCFGQRLTGEQVAWDALQAWLGASFLKGRHGLRVEKISKLEKR
jgi:ribose 5-phosphate isomerase B